jgi:uncharacterized protein (DUF4415 family)
MATTRVKLTGKEVLSREARERFAAVRDEDIDTSDIPELDREWFAKARLVTPAERKHQMTIRIDGDVIEWFKAQGKGYQTHMNAVLREYVKAQRK